MAIINIKNIENVEGKYHVMFFEGKNIIEAAKNDLRYALISLLLFALVLVACIILSGFNLYYIGFGLVFLLFFLLIFIYLQREKRKGVKQCIYAVQNSRTTDIINKQVDNRKATKAFVRSMSTTLDKYDVKKKYPHLLQKYKRRRRHNHIVGIITQFEEDNKQKNK